MGQVGTLEPGLSVVGMCHERHIIMTMILYGTLQLTSHYFIQGKRKQTLDLKKWAH